RPPQDPANPYEALAARLADAMGEAWRRGERPPAEKFLDDYPELYDHPEAAIRVIYEEVCLRQDHGLAEDTEAFLARFPRWRAELEILLDCHQLLQQPRDAAPVFPEVGEQLGDL